MPLWLIIVLVVLVVLVAGGMIARRRQLARTRPAFERTLAKVDRDLAAASAADRGWDRGRLEAVAREAAVRELGAEPEDLELVEVVDRPGTDEDEAVFRATAGGRERHVTLKRSGDEWVGTLEG